MDNGLRGWTMVWNIGPEGSRTKFEVDILERIKGQDERHYLVDKIQTKLMPNGQKVFFKMFILQGFRQPAARLQEILDLLTNVPSVYGVFNDGSAFNFNFDLMHRDDFHRRSIEILEIVLEKLGVNNEGRHKSLSFSCSLESIDEKSGIHQS